MFHKHQKKEMVYHYNCGFSFNSTLAATHSLLLQGNMEAPSGISMFDLRETITLKPGTLLPPSVFVASYSTSAVGMVHEDGAIGVHVSGEWWCMFSVGEEHLYLFAFGSPPGYSMADDQYGLTNNWIFTSFIIHAHFARFSTASIPQAAKTKEILRWFHCHIIVTTEHNDVYT